MKNFIKILTKKKSQGIYEPAVRIPKQQWYQVLFSNLNTPVTFWTGFFIVLFFYLQKQLSFHFYYIEQEQLFLYNRTYLWSVLMEPAGFVRLITEYAVQFFILPYAGALIMSALFTCIGMLTAGIIKRIAPKANLFILSLLPIVLLLFVHFDNNYNYRGTTAYMLMLCVLYGYFHISNGAWRLVYVTLSGALLFWGAGAVAFLFVILVLLWELMVRFSSAYRFILPILVVTGLAFWSIYAAMIGDPRFLFLPDGYFNFRLRPFISIYFSWIFLPILLTVCRLMRNRNIIRSGRKLVEMCLLMIVVAATFWFGMDKFAKRNEDFYKELDYYMRTEQWNKIIEKCHGNINNYLYMSCLNVALAEKGELGDRMFSFEQNGVQSILLPWNREPHLSVLLSDVYFSMGHIAMAQRMAFESNESITNNGAPRMLKRLIQTNLIYGAYPLAEKYITKLEQTRFYKDWAHDQRRFLWNDKAIESDSLLAIKRKCIPKTNFLSELQGLYVDLELIAQQNPEHKASIQYAIAFCLLAKELPYFEEIVKRNYRTAVLPALPESYQEALIILHEQDPDALEAYDISESVYNRFADFRRQVLPNKNNPSALRGLLKKTFGDTYWYYYMFKQLKPDTY